jgi:hypothetical protein
VNKFLHIGLDLVVLILFAKALLMTQEGISFVGEFEHFWDFRKYVKLEKIWYFFIH